MLYEVITCVVELHGSGVDLGDARATEIYGKAYAKNAEFYDFYRSMNAYRSALANKQDVLVLEPDSEFFKYFGTDLSE